MSDMGGLVLFSEGKFGRAVAERLRVTSPGVMALPLLASLGALDELVAQASFVGVALWRPYPQAMHALDKACARHGVAWSSVTLEGKFLTMGPLVVPGGGACYLCYAKRRATHWAQPDREQALDAAYRSDLESGCEGFPPGSVTIAATALRLDRADTNTGAGRVRTLDLLHCVIEETRVVRVHDCERCGQPLQPLQRGERYVRHLRAALEGTVP